MNRLTITNEMVDRAYEALGGELFQAAAIPPEDVKRRVRKALSAALGHLANAEMS